MAAVTALDPDEGDAGDVEYSIVQTSQPLQIEIGQSTGVITSTAVQQIDTQELRVTVRATDKVGKPFLNDFVVVLIRIKNMFHIFVFVFRVVSLPRSVKQLSRLNL